MTTDLSSFYQHTLDYSQYVTLAYGLSAFVLGCLVTMVLNKYWKNKKVLSSLEDQGE